MEGGPQRHGVDCQRPIIGELENDHFEQVARFVGADHEQLRRVVVLLHVDNDNRVGDSVLDCLVIDLVASC